MRGFIVPLLFALACILNPAVSIAAQQEKPVDNNEIANKAKHLKSLLDDLLSNPNSSSIQKAIKNGDAQAKPLLDKALELKSRGEALLNEKNYLEAAVHFQSSLQYVMQAIRTQTSETENPPTIKAKLDEKLKTNESFIAAATSIVMQESNGDAIKLLKMAKEARIKAEAESKQGRGEAALAELENSTRLAQQAIMLVRQGKVMERN